MRHLLTATGLGLFLVLASSVSQSSAETVTDAKLGFTLELSPEFTPRPDLVGVTPDIVHAFQFGEGTEDELAVIMMIEKMGGRLGRERLTRQNMPPGFSGDLLVVKWREFDVNGLEVPEIANGIEAVTYNVQIPLKGEAVQVKLFGPADRKEELRSLLSRILNGLKGESNWLSSASPPSIADSDNYRTVLLCLAIVGVVIGLVALWFVSRCCPKGTVLGIAAILYIASWQMDDSNVREVRLLVGVMRMLGFAGLILGVIDMLRKRKPKETADISEEVSEGDTSPEA